MPADTEASIRDLKNLRGDRPRIVVVEAVHQRGKGLDVRRQTREKEDGLPIWDRKVAVGSEQISITIADIRQEQDAG